MFQSFFPQPKLFFSSLALWSGILILVWYSFGKTIGESLGFDLAETETVIGLGHFITSEFLWFDTFFAFTKPCITWSGDPTFGPLISLAATFIFSAISLAKRTSLVGEEYTISSLYLISLSLNELSINSFSCVLAPI